MTCTGTTLPYRALLSHPEPYAANVSETAGGDAPHDMDWRLGGPARSTSHELQLEAAVRSTLGAGTQGLVTSLTLPGIGRFEMVVHHDVSHIAIRIHCDARPGYLWLAAKRGMLEQRLARALRCPASVEVSPHTST